MVKKKNPLTFSTNVWLTPPSKRGHVQGSSSQLNLQQSRLFLVDLIQLTNQIIVDSLSCLDIVETCRRVILVMHNYSVFIQLLLPVLKTLIVLIYFLLIIELELYIVVLNHKTHYFDKIAQNLLSTPRNWSKID